MGRDFQALSVSPSTWTSTDTANALQTVSSRPPSNSLNLATLLTKPQRLGHAPGLNRFTVCPASDIDPHHLICTEHPTIMFLTAYEFLFMLHFSPPTWYNLLSKYSTIFPFVKSRINTASYRVRFTWNIRPCLYGLRLGRFKRRSETSGR
jgi:hypothetical protein